MKGLSSILLALFLASAASVSPVWSQLALGQGQSADETSTPPAAKLQAVGFVTWWSHDATGYHPAIMLRVENASGNDLTGQPIKFQAQFRDLRNGYVTVARREVRWLFYKDQDQYVTLKGPQAFELPIDEFQWPPLEVKVMSRVGSVGDEGTQDVLLTKLNQKTMTDEEASARLAEILPQPHIKSSSAHHNKSKPEHGTTEIEKPLVATALPLGAKLPTPKAAAPEKGSLSHFLNMPRLAGLGDDFYEFDQVFGKTADFDAKDTRSTWVHYEPEALDLFVCAKGRTSKCDMLVAVIPSHNVQQEPQMVALARALAGKFKNQPTDTPNRTVKYLPSGRIQLATFGSPGYKVFYVSPRGGGDDNNYVLVMSRLGGDLRATLAENVKRTRMLKFLLPIVEDAEGD